MFPDYQIQLFSLDLNTCSYEKYEQIISNDERVRADKFVFKKDKNKFIKSRGYLRMLIGNYLEKDPALIKFKYSPIGKPYLKDSELRFNLSHSHNKTIIAFAQKTDLGVDLEYIRDIKNIEQLAEQYFSKEECQEINNLEKDLRENLFFKYWTYKEAYLKATGEGVKGLEDIDFKIPLDKKSFSFIDQHGRVWHNETISMNDGYTGAIVVKGSKKNISYHYT